MLIPMKELSAKYNIMPTGILHVGAHECEEFSAYVTAGTNYKNIFWVEAMQKKVDKMQEKYGDKLNMYQAVIDTEDGKEVSFKITSNGESSSILDFGSYSAHHPHVTVTDTQMLQTTRLDTLIDAKTIPIDTIDFLKISIQGVELRALQSMEKYLHHIKYIYTEVNTEQVYKNCTQLGEINAFLKSHGFERVESRIYKQLGRGDALYIRMLKTTHNAGFFSCCSVKLYDIANFLNSNKKLPDIVDSSQQFEWYKNDKNKDITFDYFENYNITDDNIIQPIHYHHDDQYTNYAELDYKCIIPLVKKYFSPSVEIIETINSMEKKYNLIYENICVLFYRGNDKNRETNICNYDEYLNYANQIITQNPKIMFLIQSDETGFIEFMTNIFPNNSFYFKDEIRHVTKCNSTVDILMRSTNYEFSKKYLAITIIMSKCKYIICGSGNCDIWIMLYRGNAKNVIQNNKGSWYNSVV